MAKVIPFRALRYNQEIVPDLARVVSPPYDIINAAEQKHYHQKDPHNAIWLDYGLERAGNDKENNRYTRAAAALNQWLEQQIIVPDAEPALYFLKEEFTGPGGQPALRQGFVAAVRLAPFSEGVILPHEETASAPKEDRLRLMEATQANLSPIFCLYSDPENQIATALKKAADSKPDINLTDEAGTRHSLWVINGPDTTSLVTRILSEKTLLIADGHHRYETALKYRDTRRQQESSQEDQPYDYLMAYLTNMADSSHSILPIHRLVCGLAPQTPAGLEDILKQKFEIENIDSSGPRPAQAMIERMAAAGRQRNVFGMFVPATGSYYLLVARASRPLLDAVIVRSAAWRSLDVSVLDHLVLRDLLDITPGGVNAGARVSYVERTEEALDEAENCELAFFVNPTSMEEITAVAEAGEKMPQKSTYFHPKPLTGLVFRSFKF